MDKKYKWMLLSQDCPGSRSSLDRLCHDYQDIPDSDPRLCSSSALSILNTIDKKLNEEYRLVCYPESDYPDQLRQLSRPPAVLYIKGNGQLPKGGEGIAVVGSRRATPYGLTVTADFCRDLCQTGFVIVSGGARGVDTAASEAALKFGGRTVVVLGCGADVVYPEENAQLFDRVAGSDGLIISEYFFGAKPNARNFPKRNRIIAALSGCCLVTEAGLHSGSLITAELASDLRRPVFAVPGNITSAASAGTNSLIRGGCFMATDPMQLASEMRAMLSFGQDRSKRTETLMRGKPLQQRKPSKKERVLSPDEERVVDLIRHGRTSKDEIMLNMPMEETVLNNLLVMMELNGIIKKCSGNLYMEAD